MTKAKGKIKKLLIVIGDIQQLVGSAIGYHNDDRNLNGFEIAQKKLQKVFDMCVEARSEYDPIEEEEE